MKLVFAIFGKGRSDIFKGENGLVRRGSGGECFAAVLKAVNCLFTILYNSSRSEASGLLASTGMFLCVYSEQ